MLKSLRNGSLITILVICGLFYISWLTTRLPQPPNKDVTRYLEKTLPLIVRNWNPQDLRDYSSPYFSKLLEGNRKKELNVLFERGASKLGKLKYIEITNTTKAPSMSSAPASVDCYYCKTPAIFDKGKAEIETSVLMDHKNLSLQSFNILFE